MIRDRKNFSQLNSHSKFPFSKFSLQILNSYSRFLSIPISRIKSLNFYQTYEFLWELRRNSQFLWEFGDSLGNGIRNLTDVWLSKCSMLCLLYKFWMFYVHVHCVVLSCVWVETLCLTLDWIMFGSTMKFTMN